VYELITEIGWFWVWFMESPESNASCL